MHIPHSIISKIVTNLTHDNEMHKQYEKNGISTEGNTLSFVLT